MWLGNLTDSRVLTGHSTPNQQQKKKVCWRNKKNIKIIVCKSALSVAMLFSKQQIRHFFIQKMLISFLFLNKNICCWYSLEAPRRGASNEYPQHMYLSRNKKNIMWIPPLICSYVTPYVSDLAFTSAQFDQILHCLSKYFISEQPRTL